jgi:lipopolysaccharide export system permease protein
MKKTISLYILKEIFPIFFIGLMTFTVILLMDKIFRLIELIVTRGVSLGQILKLLLFISPSFLIFTIPMAVLLATLLGFGRLSADSEITAFKASGLSLYRLFLPVSAFSLGAYLLTTVLVFYGLPWGTRGFTSTLFSILESKADVEIKERVFNDFFEGLVVYVDKIPIQGKRMEGILIYDERDKEAKNTIFAKEGILVSNPESKEVILRLFHGDIHRLEPKANVYQRLQFDVYDLRLELSKYFAAAGGRLKDREMSIDDVKRKILIQRLLNEDTTPQEVELHKRYAIPFVCLIFGLIGVPLGIQPCRSGRSHGFLFSILILLAYYVSLSASEIFALRKTFPPVVAGWAPNLLFGGFGVYLFFKAAKDSPFKPMVWVDEALDTVQEAWRRLFGDT